MGGNQEFKEGKEFDAAKAEAAVCSEMNFIKNGYVLTVKGIEKVNDVEVYVMDIKKDGADMTYFIDTKTHLIIRTISNAETEQGIIQQITELSDYRSAGGVLFPYSIVQKVPSMGMEIKMTVTDIQVNTGLTIEDFK